MAYSLSQPGADYRERSIMFAECEPTYWTAGGPPGFIEFIAHCARCDLAQAADSVRLPRCEFSCREASPADRFRGALYVLTARALA